MTLFRTTLFWLHLVAGISAGAVVLIMSITGVALTYEKQMVEWADRQAWSAPSSAEAGRLAPETLLAKVQEARPDAVPTTLTLRADPAAPATVAFDGAGPVLVDPTTGLIIGAPPGGLRTFFRTMTTWHRWLAQDGPTRGLGKSITGAANLAFLFIVLSGIYIWVPRIWSRLQFRQVIWFRGGLGGKARDFNWHNVIGVWSAVPLAIVVAGAVPISYPWASNLVYHLLGEAPPRPNPGASGSRSADHAPPADPIDPAGIDIGFVEATHRVAGWRSLTIRIPRTSHPSLVFTVDEGYGGQPQKRGTLTISRVSGEEEKWETFADSSPGRRLRSWLRFAHTGEYYGLTGQTIAGMVSAGGAVLVWTGLALALRRLLAWLRRRRAAISADSPRKAA